MHVNSYLVLWIKDFLQDRAQRFSVHGHRSKGTVLSSGVPQGSVLSPILFSIYTDHMRFQNAVTRLFKFADDIALVGLSLDKDSSATYF